MLEKQIKTSLVLEPKTKEKLLKLLDSGKVSEYGKWMLEELITQLDKDFKKNINVSPESYEDFLSYSKMVLKKISEESEASEQSESKEKLRDLDNILTNL
ncbi:hypothetical protein HQ489_05345 [Candidatus Woesearchaeota archaeon]|nr:hypothetical protein [Candidatus Woesearchaeota archaeon]